MTLALGDKRYGCGAKVPAPEKQKPYGLESGDEGALRFGLASSGQAHLSHTRSGCQKLSWGVFQASIGSKRPLKSRSCARMPSQVQ